MIWIAIGILCLIIEIFTPGFLFMSFGIGAILTGLTATFISNITIQIVIFAIITFILFINLRKLSKKLIAESSEKTNVNALIDKMGNVTKEIPEFGRGYVKVDGEEWSAVSKNKEKIKESQKVVVIDIEGNKLIVKKTEEEE
ncbi:MAG: NfeD family protein [Candidatus Cloacimonetes bacterium]|nr:NfeD family protein [Candidatus Cloacimonadota bacterium]